MEPSELRTLVTPKPLGVVPEDVRLNKQLNQQLLLHSCRTQTTRVKIICSCPYRTHTQAADPWYF